VHVLHAPVHHTPGESDPDISEMVPVGDKHGAVEAGGQGHDQDQDGGQQAQVQGQEHGDGGGIQAQVREDDRDNHQEQSEASKLAANKPKKKIPPDITTAYTKSSPDAKSQDIQANMYLQSNPTKPEIIELANKQGEDGQGTVDVVIDDEGGGNLGDDSRERVRDDCPQSV
jgi:hypothetical protein